MFRIQFIQKQTEQVLVLALIICLKIDLSAWNVLNENEIFDSSDR